MRLLHHIGPFGRYDYPADLLKELTAIHPTTEPSTYEVRNLPDGDPALPRLFEALRRAGLEPHDRDGAFDPRRHFAYAIQRVYDRRDLDAAPMVLLVGPFPHVGLVKSADGMPSSSYRDPLGRLRFPAKCLPPGNEPSGIVDAWLGHAASETIRGRIELEGLKHVAFRETVVALDEPKHYNPVTSPWREEWGEPWWELTGDLWMPPVSPSSDLRTAGGAEVSQRALPTRNFSGAGLHVRESFFMLPELRYRLSDLKRTMPAEWDIARTWEATDERWDQHQLVCSQRFRAFVEGEGVRPTWIPVRIEEES